MECIIIIALLSWPSCCYFLHLTLIAILVDNETAVGLDSCLDPNRHRIQPVRRQHLLGVCLLVGLLGYYWASG